MRHVIMMQNAIQLMIILQPHKQLLIHIIQLHAIMLDHLMD